MCIEWTDEDVEDVFHRLESLELQSKATKKLLDSLPQWVFEYKCCPPGESYWKCD